MTVIIIIFAVLALADVFLMWCLLRAGAMCERQDGIYNTGDKNEDGEGRQQK